jgi:centromere-localized protein 2
MAPTEESILRSFLLQKAGVRDVLTLAEFSTYFPSSKRSSPLVRQLFRDIQTQRNVVCESVLKQINLECRMGDNMIAKKRAEREVTVTESRGPENDMESGVISFLIPYSRN